ncbi:MAG: T9SS type A sorting domain-containing protein [Candidatus Marinimicrobia bacterium]|nr:T9SS type A sorting domain-containing protein [Candidatus Neomarinimicrobiota bacterium]
MKQTKYKTRMIRITLGILLCVTLFMPELAAYTIYPFQELVFNFGAEDSILVNSLDNNGNDAGNQSKPYGMIIDPEGKMWLGFYSGFSNEIVRSPSNLIELTGLRCFLPNKTEASFSPIEILEFSDGSKDTLYAGNPYNGYCRGISLADDGNILYTAGPTLYKIDYSDGSAIAKWDPTIIGKPLRTHISAVQDCSYIYFAPYPQFEQLHVLDEDLNFVSAGISLTPTLQNAIQVRTKSNEITQLFSATHSNGQGIFVYESSDPATVPFAIVDTIANYSEETDTNIITYYAWANSMNWVDKEEGIMIYGNDHRAMTSVNTGNPPPSSHAARWVVLDVDEDLIVCMFGAPWYDVVSGEAIAKEVDETVPETYLELNAMGMSPSGAVVLTEGDYYGYLLTDKGLNCVQHVSWLTDISDEHYIPYKLELSQNYPNPFNPNTNIQFHLKKAEKVALDIHDLSGKRVMRVFSGYMESGFHNMSVNASGLASGTYIYTLHTSALSVSRKMTVLK